MTCHIGAWNTFCSEQTSPLNKRSVYIGTGAALQIEQEVVQLHMGLLMDALPDEEGQLVGVLAGGRHSDDALRR